MVRFPFGKGNSVPFSPFLLLHSSLQVSSSSSQRKMGGNDRLTKQMSAQLFLCQEEYCVIGRRIIPSNNTGSIFAPHRICVITLAGSHPVLQSGKVIKSISYQISTNCSRLQNKVSGKFKRVCSCISLPKSSIVIIMVKPASPRTQ